MWCFVPSRVRPLPPGPAPPVLSPLCADLDPELELCRRTRTRTRTHSNRSSNRSGGGSGWRRGEAG